MGKKKREQAITQNFTRHLSGISDGISSLDENGLRDFIFRNYKETFYDLIKGEKPSPVWETAGFPHARFLIQQDTERRINRAVDDLRSLVIDGQEVRLGKTTDATTRIDLLGRSEEIGLTIIELKKSKQTERQAFTELLAYANHFSVLFPGLRERNILAILVAPMESRTVRDAYFQELVTNRKNIVALIPKVLDSGLSLEVYYPDEQYYRWVENNIFDDRAFFTVVASFPEIDGWIDTDRNNRGTPPDYSVEALNTIALLIAQKLEASGLHGMVYARQLWGELVGVYSANPNSIIVSVLDPFSSFRSDLSDGVVSGETAEGRISEIQLIVDQLVGGGDYWLEGMNLGFRGDIIRIVQESFDMSFRQVQQPPIQPEISLPFWAEFKTTMVEVAICYNFNLFTTGLVREVYHEYIKYIYTSGYDKVHYADDLPMFSYDTLNKFFPAWEILKSFSLAKEETD